MIITYIDHDEPAKKSNYGIPPLKSCICMLKAICGNVFCATGKRSILDKKKNRRQKRPEADSLRRELHSYEEKGTHLYLDDKPSKADEIVNACIFAEDSDYMRDFVSDDNDHITEIHFNRIK